jgi:hypothetical protein
MKKFILIFLCLSILSTAEENVRTSHLLIGGGINNISKPRWRTTEFYIEYKFPCELHKFRPLLGIMISLKQSYYIYGGLDANLIFYRHFLVLPGFAAGFYHKGNGRDLGCPIEFRSSIAVGWQFSNLSRLGLMFYHISNAHLGKNNPGMESLVFFYGFAF